MAQSAITHTLKGPLTHFEFKNSWYECDRDYLVKIDHDRCCIFWQQYEVTLYAFNEEGKPVALAKFETYNRDEAYGLSRYVRDTVAKYKEYVALGAPTSKARVVEAQVVEDEAKLV